jgi:MOSC domain-containing protein YiiM
VTRLDALFTGALEALDGVGDPTGIYKTPARGTLRLETDGLVGDRQADRRHHGGPERAVSHYPAEFYPDWARSFPRTPDAFAPGAFGENLSTAGMTEDSVCIGDIYRLGSATIQISQPRSPCWKVSRRMGLRELAVHMADSGRCGWLYRVLTPGEVQTGDHFQRQARPRPEWPLARLWLIRNDEQARPELLQAAAVLPELSENWRGLFANRLRNLRRRSGRR